MSQLNFEFIPWQIEAVEDKTRFKTVVAGRRCGKTRFSVVLTIIKALECPATDAGVMYVAPTQGMARVLCWNLLMDLGRKVISSSNINNGEIKMVNGITVYVRGADSPDSLRGMKLYHVTLDEMQMMKESTWEWIVRPALSDMKGTALFIGTPVSGQSLFRDHFERGISGEDPEWKSWHLTTYDNPFIDKKEIDLAKRSMSTFAFKQEYLASFDTMGSDVFKEEWFKYGPEPKQGDYYIAVDLAGFEDVSDPNKKKYLDDTAIAVVKITPEGHWWVKKVEMFRKDVRETAVRILMNIRTFRPVMIGMEKGTLMRAVTPYLVDLMGKHSLYAHIEPITTSTSSKENRVIYALQGLFEHGRVTFSEDGEHDKLKDQLLMFPSKKAHDDGPDSLSLIAHMQSTVYSDPNDTSEEYEPVDVISGI